MRELRATSEGDGGHLRDLYQARFDERELAFKREMWRVLCEHFFQRYVKQTDTVLDLGAGTCEFINSIKCERKLAVDLNPDLAKHAIDAEPLQADSTDMSSVRSQSVDVIFCSNFFEHMPTKEHLLRSLAECERVLRAGGTLIVLQPNIRYLPGRYWDFFDHHTPLTHLSMVEALRLSGFVPREVVPRFLPYTVKDRRIPHSLPLVRAYLRLRPLWRIFGRQMLVVAERQP
ncbi:MAG: class I SAM-dependent methyltransferase [Actinomycetota bacterium]|nr:class I SAM-dependent methyltransferase [Actinomycetota bacterium]